MNVWTTVLYEGELQERIFIEAEVWYDAREICRTQYQDLADAMWLTLKPTTPAELSALNPEGVARILFRDKNKQILERVDLVKTKTKKDKK